LSKFWGKAYWVKVIQILRQIKYNNFFELECEIHEMAEAVKFIKKLISDLFKYK